MTAEDLRSTETFKNQPAADETKSMLQTRNKYKHTFAMLQLKESSTNLNNYTNEKQRLSANSNPNIFKYFLKKYLLPNHLHIFSNVFKPKKLNGKRKSLAMSRLCWSSLERKARSVGAPPAGL